MTTEHEAALYKELILYPSFLEELIAIQEDTCGVLLSSPLLSHQNNISRGKKSSGGSRVERLVVNVLTSRYVMELELLVAAGRALYEDSQPSDRNTLLCLWQMRSLEEDAFPSRLLYRYQYFKEELALRAAGA